MIKRLLIVLCLMFFLPFYCFAVLTEKEEVHFETNLWVYAPLYYGADTNTYIGFTSSTQIVFRLDGSNTYFNKVWEDTEEDNILTADINANNFSITNAGTFQGSNFITRAGVTLNAPPSFSAISSSAQLITNAVWTRVKFPSEYWDIGSGWDTVNNIYIPPIAGKYEFYCFCRIENLAALDSFYISLYKDGASSHLIINYSPANGDFTSQFRVQLQLTATNQISFYVNQGGTAVETLKAYHSWVYGRYIGD